MQAFLIAIHMVICFSLVCLVLIQHGKGAEAGASFGGGASQTLFGSKGTGNFLTHTTAVLATLFFINSLVLGFYLTRRDDGTSILQRVEQRVETSNISEENRNIELPN
jgi:preprotein translocase subunit SecG